MFSILIMCFGNYRHHRQHLQIYWNSSNRFFHSSGFLTVYLGDLIDFLCPYYDEDQYSNINIEYNTLYLVNENDYYHCNTTNYNPLLKCNKPFDTRLMYTLSISKYLPYPNLPEFHAGHLYYFISTSSGKLSNIDQRYNGLCRTKKMKLIINVQKYYRHYYDEYRQWPTPIVAKRTNLSFIDLDKRFFSFSSLSSITSQNFYLTFVLISSNSIYFHTKTRSTQLINRMLFGSTTECSIRLGRKQFTLKFYKMITCRYVENLSNIYPYLLKYSHDITALEITDSIIKNWNINQYAKVFRRFQFLIFHRTTIINKTLCSFNTLSSNLFYLHLTNFSPSLENFFSNQSCLIMKRLHVLILDHTDLGNKNILLDKFPNLHILRLNFSSFNHPLNYSYIRLFPYLQDFFLKFNDDCHRCEYEWLKYATRDNNYILFHISPNSGCMDWNRGGKFLQWQHAPLCGSCSLPLIINKKKTNNICKMEDGITEHYCKAFYGQQSLFQPWTNIFEKKTIKIIELPSTIRPSQEFMKSKYTTPIIKQYKRDIHSTFPTTTQLLLVTNDSNIISPPPITNLTTSQTSTISYWQSRLIVTRKSINLFNRSHCNPIVDSLHRPKVRLNLPSLIDQLFNISQQYTPNCSNIQCNIIHSNYLGPICLKNGLTYANICEILFALCTKQLDPYNLQIDYFGSCVTNCSLVSRCYSNNEICIMTPKPHCISRQRNCTGFSPVCDTYGKTFVNRCHLSNSLVFNQPRQIAYRGPCRLKRQCTKNLCRSNEICIQTQDKYHYPICMNCNLNETMKLCPFELFCGDNKRQYINRCQLYYERCQTKTFIKIDYFGLCHHHQNHNDDYETNN
ncbi:unnamed protein product [Rotaria sordida]|uniref:Kazal-like domain-containing protein n=1 Tax=Rotaria sordida TaxID=392033 RepID=A0A815M0V0_9BILA|nr:unnamed protein product [Rotaria sordida]CAF3806398.1 unnamed protein product [Rotaria sordida]